VHFFLKKSWCPSHLAKISFKNLTSRSAWGALTTCPYKLRQIFFSPGGARASPLATHSFNFLNLHLKCYYFRVLCFHIDFCTAKPAGLDASLTLNLYLLITSRLRWWMSSWPAEWCCQSSGVPVTGWPRPAAVRRQSASAERRTKMSSSTWNPRCFAWTNCSRSTHTQSTSISLWNWVRSGQVRFTSIKCSEIRRLSVVTSFLEVVRRFSVPDESNRFVDGAERMKISRLKPRRWAEVQCWRFTVSDRFTSLVVKSN